jgi:hypothetical protein
MPDVNAIRHDTNSYLLDLSLALQSCDLDIRYHEIAPPTAVDSGNANHESTSECLYACFSADKVIDVARFGSSSALSAIRRRK